MSATRIAHYCDCGSNLRTRILPIVAPVDFDSRKCDHHASVGYWVIQSLMSYPCDRTVNCDIRFGTNYHFSGFVIFASSAIVQLLLRFMRY